jgi:hypothetical protein
MDVGSGWTRGRGESFVENEEVGAAARLASAYVDRTSEFYAEGAELTEKN